MSGQSDARVKSGKSAAELERRVARLEDVMLTAGAVAILLLVAAAWDRWLKQHG